VTLIKKILSKVTFRVEGTMFHEKISHKMFQFNLLKNKGAKKKTKQVGVSFYFFKNVHIPILIPIYKKIKELHPEIRISFAYKSFEPAMRAGFLKHEVDLIKSYGEDVYIVPQHTSSDITFVADSVYDWVGNCGKIVNVGHGILSKGLYYSDTVLAKREEAADLVFVPGSYHQQIMQEIITTPIFAVGMAKLDALFDGSIKKEDVQKQLAIKNEQFQYILFAPTFNDELSAIPYVLDRIVEVIPEGGSVRLIIKLHGTTKQVYKDMYKELALKDERVIFSDDLDIVPLLILADIMISDVSSAMIEFAALDKPIILFNNPDRFKYKNYNESDIEYKFRDMGIEVNNIDEMKEAVLLGLKSPSELSSKRRNYTDILLANKNTANACEIIVKESLELFAN